MSYTRAASCSLETGARNMTDFIERKAAFDAAQEHFCDSARTLEAIETLPAADVRPVVRGRWVKSHAVVGIDAKTCGVKIGETDRCSVCGEEFVRPIKEYKFCPNCGADMKGGDGE